MAAVIKVVEGQTSPIECTLTVNGLSVAIQGATAELILTKANGTLVDTTGDATVLDDGSEALKGRVRYSPDAGDFVATEGALRARWKITDIAGKIAFFPSDEADVVEVRKP